MDDKQQIRGSTPLTLTKNIWIMGKTIISCDPGAEGFLCAWNLDTNNREYISIKDSTRGQLADFLNGHKDGSVAIMEEVHAVFGSSAKATFNFGEIFGFLQGLFVALKVPYHLVQPKDWQASIWINADKVFKPGKISPKTGKVIRMVDTKPTSINAATRLFPDIDFRRTSSCKKIDDNKVDATLIGEYARRINL